MRSECRELIVEMRELRNGRLNVSGDMLNVTV